MNGPLALSALQQAHLIRRRDVSSVELTRAHLDRISAINGRINAVAEVLSGRALAEAAKADEKTARGEATGIFHGVPFSIKDSIELAGTRTTAGTVGRSAAEVSTADATLVARLRAAGAIPLARTNLPELLFAFESDNLLFGATANPYDPERTSGGSSGGEAALIAACGSPMGLGSDAAGSVRLPANFCGIAALKPTSGRLSRAGHFPPAGGWIEALWQIGPMARRVEDLSAMMAAMAGPDSRDPSACCAPMPADGNINLRRLRVAFYTGNGFMSPEPAVAGVVRAAAAALAGETASVTEDRPICVADAYDLEMKLIGVDGGDGLRSYAAALGSTRLHPLLTAWLDKLEPYRTDLAGFAGYWAEWDCYRAEMTAFLRRYDAVVSPVYTHPALPHGASTIDENFRGFGYTMAYNVAGWPAATVRCGASETGLPIGVQVAAAPWREDIALAVAARLESIFGGWQPPARLLQP